MSPSSGPAQGIDEHLQLCNRLAQAALDRAGGERLLESDRTTLASHSYTEPHLALLLFLLNDSGIRSAGLDEVASRLEIWNALEIRPIFFCSMAVSLLGIAARDDNIRDERLAAALAAIQVRRVDYADTARGWTCGNNMLVQQHVVDELLAPLSEGRPCQDGAADRLVDLFASCQGSDGFFFDLPRPGLHEDRQFPLTYNLKFLFLLILCQKYLPDTRFEEMLSETITAALQMFTNDGDCSVFGRTDRSTFAAGLACFVLRAAASMNIGGAGVSQLAKCAEQRFEQFPVGRDGCLEVNELGSSASVEEQIWSRDDYAFRWQYAISGLAYSLLGRKMFPGSEGSPGSAPLDRAPSTYSSADLGITRFQGRDQDLFVRSLCAPETRDRRHAGPTILRFESGDQKLVGTIPNTFSFDSRVLLRDSGRSRLRRHFDLLGYRWRYGQETLHAELAGFVPTLTNGHQLLVPGKLLEQKVTEHSITTRHQFMRIAVSGPTSVWNHVAELARIRAPSFLKRLLRNRSPFRGEANVILERELGVESGAITISDRIAGRLTHYSLVIGARSFSNCRFATRNLEPIESGQGWSSDGVQTIQLYSADCGDSAVEYEIQVVATD